MAAIGPKFSSKKDVKSCTTAYDLDQNSASIPAVKFARTLYHHNSIMSD